MNVHKNRSASLDVIISKAFCSSIRDPRHLVKRLRKLWIRLRGTSTGFTWISALLWRQRSDFLRCREEEAVSKPIYEIASSNNAMTDVSRLT